MSEMDAGRGVFTHNDLRRIFDALEAARPDLADALDLVRIAVGLKSSAACAAGRVVDAEWKVSR